MKFEDKFFLKKYGPCAIVTGCACGIGAEFAVQLARAGFDLIMVDKKKKELIELSRRLSRLYGISANPVEEDLSGPDFLKSVKKAVAGRDVGLLVNNAGTGPVGEFLNASVNELLNTLYVNCRAPLLLTREFAGLMKSRGRGGVIFLSSMSAYQGTPIVANYAATKAYNLVLGESLWDELKSAGIDVLSVSPGPTDTPAWREGNPDVESVPGIIIMKTGPVVREALGSLGKRPSVVPGKINSAIQSVTSIVMARRFAIILFGKNIRKLYRSKIQGLNT
ncbi:MAG: SDR family NAD(P)-dependent oxidoreductase [Spirochaetes bacterium]|jgi:hypothetical protein|nr:SDR family NAD(P)-dependent oxidoreductase [Spirochaetota bacterium]